MAFHGIETRRIISGVRPISVGGQSTIGIVGTAPNADPDGEFGENGVLQYNKPHYITARPSEANLGKGGTLAAALDQIYAQGRMAVQMVIVPVGSSRTIGTTHEFTNTVFSSQTTKAGIDALAAHGFGVVESGGRKFLAFKNPPASDITKFQQLQVGDQIVIKTNVATPITVQTYTLESTWSVGSKWFRINNDAETTGLADGTAYKLDSPARPAQSAEDAERANLLGSQGLQSGIYALESANPAPKILCVPHPEAAKRINDAANPVAANLSAIAARIRAIAVLDGPGTDVDDMLLYARDFDGPQIYMVDPWVRTASGVSPASASIAGLISVNDARDGFWTSPSNTVIQGVLATNREISSGFVGSEADVLNSNQIATIIKDGGFRLWGNEGLATIDPTYRFLQIYRTANAIEESLISGLKWAISENITVRTFENVAQSVQGFLDKLTSDGAITGGECFPDDDANTPATVKEGIANFIVRWSGVYPVQTLKVKINLVDDYLESNLLDLI